MTRIFIQQDMEGVAGVTDGAYGRARSDASETTARLMMTREINAAVEGILEAEAEAEVLVAEAHPFPLLDVHEKARVVRGLHPGLAVDLEADALMFVGQHAMAGKRRAVLSHTGSSRSIQSITVNGRAFGEMGLFAALHGERGRPVILVTGDSAAADEAREFFGEVETVSTMEAHGNHAAVCLTNAESCRCIRAAARRAMEGGLTRAPFVVTPPVEIRVRYAFPEIADYHGFVPGVARVDDCTVAYLADSFREAFRGAYMCATLVLARYDPVR